MAKGRNPARDRKVLVEEAVNGIWWERVPTDAQGGCAAASGGPEVSPSSSNAGGAAAEQEIPEVMDVEEGGGSSSNAAVAGGSNGGGGGGGEESYRLTAYGEKEMSQAVTVTRVPPMLMPEGWSRKVCPM